MIRVTKLATNNAIQKHVPSLVSLFANNSAKLVQKPSFFVSDCLQIQKTDRSFRKKRQEDFHKLIFERVGIINGNPPTYSLIDAAKEGINGKKYEKKHVLFGNKAD